MITEPSNTAFIRMSRSTGTKKQSTHIHIKTQNRTQGGAQKSRKYMFYIDRAAKQFDLDHGNGW